MNTPALPPVDWQRERPVTFSGNALARALVRHAGWTLDFDGYPARQGVIAVWPHTSNWDFLAGIMTKWSTGMEVKFWGKKSLFAVPGVGAWMRWVGGVPIDRSSAHGVVGDTVEAFRVARERDETFWLAVAPEGTRSHRPGWKSGFWQVAVQAGVPLGVAALDFGRKQVRLNHFFMPTGDRERDIAAVREALAGAVGCRHENAAPITWG